MKPLFLRPAGRLSFGLALKGPEIILIFVVTATVTAAITTTVAAEAATVAVTTTVTATTVATKTTTVATTEATATVATTATTVRPALRTLFTGFGHRNVDGLAIILSLVELFNSLAAFLFIRHFHKTETSRLSGKLVGNHFC